MAFEAPTIALLRGVHQARLGCWRAIFASNLAGVFPHTSLMGFYGFELEKLCLLVGKLKMQYKGNFCQVSLTKIFFLLPQPCGWEWEVERTCLSELKLEFLKRASSQSGEFLSNKLTTHTRLSCAAAALPSLVCVGE